MQIRLISRGASFVVENWISRWPTDSTPSITTLERFPFTEQILAG